MEWIDTHCHLSFEPLHSACSDVLQRAARVGVSRVIVPAYDPDSWPRLEALARIPGVFVAFGIHPWVAQANPDIPHLSDCLSRHRAVAVGEIGLDFKVEAPSRHVQLDCFAHQLDLAQALDLPVLLHCRGAFEEMLEILQARRPGLRGVIHAFTRGPQLARRFLDCGMHLAFGGGVTRSNAERARKSARFCPGDRLLLETDAPSIGLESLPPEQVEPAHIVDIARVVAQVRGVTLEVLATESTRNAEQLFSLPA